MSQSQFDSYFTPSDPYHYGNGHIGCFTTGRDGNEKGWWSEEKLRDGTPITRVDWAPSVGIPVIPRSALHTYALHFEDGEQAGRGYRNAQITLTYRFLLCADEIQIAYTLDRKSLKHDDRYVVGPTGSGNFDYIVPAAEPSAPNSFALNLKIVTRNTATFVAPFKDAFAGEALGMGCFTGQTKRVGPMSKLVGPKPTRAQIQAFLDTLLLASAYANATPDLDEPLTNATVPTPPSAKPLHGRPTPRRAVAPAQPPFIDDTRGTTAANKAAAAAAEAQTRKILADKAAYAAAILKAQQDREAENARYHQRVAARDAEAAAIVQRNAAQRALYSACVGGDKAACTRYRAQP